jgi:hypothetical protein
MDSNPGRAHSFRVALPMLPGMAVIIFLFLVRYSREIRCRPTTTWESVCAKRKR